MEPDAKVTAPGTDMPSCPVCGAANKTAAKFCRQCGVALGVESPVLRPSGAPVDDAQARAEAPPSGPEVRPHEAAGARTSENPGGRPPGGGTDSARRSDVPPQDGTRPATRRSPPALVIGVGVCVVVVVIALVLILTSPHE